MSILERPTEGEQIEITIDTDSLANVLSDDVRYICMYIYHKFLNTIFYSLTNSISAGVLVSCINYIHLTSHSLAAC